ncbi:MAG: hypothetical protein HXX13_08720 [Bacteroidetes bacterium]|nr:hypothetical protein [Bacteroidota bacterium]
MKKIRVFATGFAIILLFQNAICQFNYQLGKEYTIRSKAQNGRTYVTTIRIDSSQIAHVRFNSEPGKTEDKAQFLVLAPVGETTTETMATQKGLIIKVPETGTPYYFINYGNNFAHQIMYSFAVEGEEVKKQILGKQINITNPATGALPLDIIYENPGDLVLSYNRKGDVLEFRSPGMLIKAKEVIFE